MPKQVQKRDENREKTPDPFFGSVEKGQPVMIAMMIELEVRLLKLVGREQLLATLSERQDCLPPELTEDWLEQQTTDRLRLLVLAARLIFVSREQARCAERARGCRAQCGSQGSTGHDLGLGGARAVFAWKTEPRSVDCTGAAQARSTRVEIRSGMAGGSAHATATDTLDGGQAARLAPP
jgi:hypothetical protein